jgi:hypothetical protein
LSRERLLVIDACIGKAIAARLRDRGRNAISTSAIGLSDNVKDPEVLRGIRALYEDDSWVLVTGDDRMPAEHGAVIHETRATIATVHPDPPDGVAEYEWLTDVIHRQAHVMQRQPPQTVRRYTFEASRVWHPRRRHVILIKRHGWTPWTPEPK